MGSQRETCSAPVHRRRGEERQPASAQSSVSSLLGGDALNLLLIKINHFPFCLCPEDGKSSAIRNLSFAQRSPPLPGQGGQMLLALETCGVEDAKFGMWGGAAAAL